MTRYRSRMNPTEYLEALKRKPTVKTLIGCLLMTTVLHVVIRFEQIRGSGDYRSLDVPVDFWDQEQYPPLGLATFETFPEHGQVRIPKIIHQTWKDTQIPVKLSSWVKSWLKKNPDYEYWLWTDETAKQLIADRHPYLLDMYENYPEAIRRADALRYVVLYEYGGVYADMDVESLKSLDPMLRKYACFVPQEPYEHPILYGNFENLVINAVMGCRPKHPFMLYVMQNLKYFSHMWNVLDSTGPHFLTNLFRHYTADNNLSATDKNGVYLTPAEYFFPTIDPSKHFWFRIQCSNFEQLTKLQKRACVGLKFGTGRQKPLPISFTNHHWIHTYLDFRVSLKGPVDIHKVVPSVKFYVGKSSKQNGTALRY